MVTIQNLEVRFEVEGDEQEQAFGRLFEKYMRRWSRQATEQAQRRRLADAERRLLPGGAGQED